MLFKEVSQEILGKIESLLPDQAPEWKSSKNTSLLLSRSSL
jgi:hypothetical protein